MPRALLDSPAGTVFHAFSPGTLQWALTSASGSGTGGGHYYYDSSGSGSYSREFIDAGDLHGSLYGTVWEDSAYDDSYQFDRQFSVAHHKLVSSASGTATGGGYFHTRYSGSGQADFYFAESNSGSSQYESGSSSWTYEDHASLSEGGEYLRTRQFTQAWQDGASGRTWQWDSTATAVAAGGMTFRFWGEGEETYDRWWDDLPGGSGGFSGVSDGEEHSSTWTSYDELGGQGYTWSETFEEHERHSGGTTTRWSQLTGEAEAGGSAEGQWENGGSNSYSAEGWVFIDGQLHYAGSTSWSNWSLYHEETDDSFTGEGSWSQTHSSDGSSSSTSSYSRWTEGQRSWTQDYSYASSTSGSSSYEHTIPGGLLGFDYNNWYLQRDPLNLTPTIFSTALDDHSPIPIPADSLVDAWPTGSSLPAELPDWVSLDGVTASGDLFQQAVDHILSIPADEFDKLLDLNDDGEATFEEIANAVPKPPPLGEMTLGDLLRLGIQTEIDAFYQLREDVQDAAEWLWNDGLDYASNFFSGFADTVTCGLTERYREWLGLDVYVGEIGVALKLLTLRRANDRVVRGHSTSFLQNREESERTSGADNPAVTEHLYDEMGRLTEKRLPDPDDYSSTGGANGPLTSRVYTYTYFDDGKLKTQTDPLSAVTAYTYNAAGQVATVTLPDPDGVMGPLPSPVEPEFTQEFC